MVGNENSKRVLKLVWGVVKHPLFLACLIFIAIILSSYLNNRSINLGAKYAIGVTRRIKKSGDLEYEFVVNGKKYVDQVWKVYVPDGSIVVPNGKYLVVYSENNPKIALILLEKPVSNTDNIDSLVNVPVDKNDIKWFML